MKIRFLIISFFLALFSMGQGYSFEEWMEDASEEKRLLPKYGGLKRTKEERKADKVFIDDLMKVSNDERDASDQMVELGFNYLYRGDLKTAMYRFNQAWLLDEENPDIYWGYGAVYMALGEYELSREQYEEGLKEAPENEKILIDYGTTYLGEFYRYSEIGHSDADTYLDQAIEKIESAYKVNPENSNATYKLSICYFYKGECAKAKEFLSESEKQGNPNITDGYRLELEETCRPEDLDCSSVRIGKFKTVDDRLSETVIDRGEEFQVEKSPVDGFQIKLKVTWIDGCTYQLEPVMGEEMLVDEENTPMILTCRITEVLEDGYIQISSSNIDPMKMKTKMVRID